MKDRKPRNPILGLDFGAAATITGMRQNDDGSITFFGPDGAVLPVKAGFAGLGYERPKGAKVTYQIPDSGEAIGSLQVALERYSVILAVDTNTIAHSGTEISVSAISRLAKLTFEGRKWSAIAEELWGLEFHDSTKSPERIGWRHAISKASEFGWLVDESKLLLVVDANLSDIHQINQRRTPIIDDFILPTGISLAYASSDSTGDSPLNGLIRHSDLAANFTIRHVISSESMALPQLLAAERTPFRAYRYWRYREDFQPHELPNKSLERGRRR